MKVKLTALLVSRHMGHYHDYIAPDGFSYIVCGEFVKQYLRNNPPKITITLSTAPFFRSEEGHYLPRRQTVRITASKRIDDWPEWGYMFAKLRTELNELLGISEPLLDPEVYTFYFTITRNNK